MGWTARRWLLVCAGAVAVTLPLVGVAAAPEPADATAASAIVGDWLVATRDAVIRIERNGAEFDGYIAWQLHDRYGPEDGPELDGRIVTDRNNPDPALRSRPLDGLRLLTGLHYDGHGEWTGGRIYNTGNGRTYHCLVRLDGSNRLVLRGYVGIPVLGKNTYWTRVTMQAPAAGGLPYVIVPTPK